MRHRRPAQCRQVDSLQRLDADRRRAGRELSLLHHRAQCRRRRRARRAPRDARPHRQVGDHHPHPPDLRRHRRPGARRLAGGGARQPVPRQHPRGRCHRPCGALLRRWRRHPCRGPHRARRRHRDHRDRADAGGPRQPREARRRPREEGARRRQGGQGEPRPRHPRAGAAARGRARPPRRRQARGGARLRHAPAPHRQAGPLRLQCRGGLRRPRQRLFRRRHGARRRGGRQGRGGVGQDRERDRHPATWGAA